MTTACISRLRDERGSILVHVTVAIIGLMAFSALVIDYGVMWSSRRQAQNSADAAALAGAVSLAFNDATDYDRARAMAQAVGQENRIFGQKPNVTLGSGNNADTTQDISFPACPPGSPAAGTFNCVRVNVYRNAVKDALPTFFGRLFGMLSQGVKASATAEVYAGNHTDCLKPWAVADRWDDNQPNPGPPATAGGIQYPNAWDPDWYTASTYDTAAGDVYGATTSTQQGTGYRIYDANGNLCCDYGLVMQLKGDQPYSAMWYQEVDLGNCGNSSDCYRDTISSCYGGTIGDTVSVKPGVSHGPTDQGVTNLMNQDPNAFWYHPTAAAGTMLATYNPNNVSIPSDLAEQCPNGCIYSPTTGINNSPRIGAIPIINPNDLANQANTSVQIMNLLGFFVIDVQGNGNNQVVRGRIIEIPGEYDSAGSEITESASFLTTIILVR
jgi:Flp pilus assembly protein TadG